MTDTYERCSCGARDRAKCSKESLSGGGKMCLKTEDSLFKNFRETLNGGFCADIDYESDAWQKVVDEWSEFKSQCVPIPKELFERMGVIKKKAEENRKKDLDNETTNH